MFRASRLAGGKYEPYQSMGMTPGVLGKVKDTSMKTRGREEQQWYAKR